MTTVTKTVKFDAAHVLTNHRGLCKNLHGHTYRVDVSVRGDESSDMVIDFKELKTLAAELICEKFDHAFIYNTSSEGEREIAAVVEKNGMRTVALPFRSTAENLAKYFYELLAPKIAAPSQLDAVRVWETADSCAEYRALIPALLADHRGVNVAEAEKYRDESIDAERHARGTFH